MHAMLHLMKGSTELLFRPSARSAFIAPHGMAWLIWHHGIA
jgi:hypothetical protein